ncbi:hypothetical protein NQ314_007847 [Rhamnusium bicolor]|uniref:WD repeat-containing protein 55 homolog n=1 Tax=Rhamnusium bicolor TaxID=1586634 RepID=A0AAV8YHH1_9CUCU|nr:hypothetical protein NQ314_007847 [Rhamnusium bicolor]
MFKKKYSKDSAQENINEDSSEFSNSDVNMTDSELNEEDNESNNEENILSDLEGVEEDEIIKAIRRECNWERDHPPPIRCEDFITDLSFHPYNHLIAVSNILGDVLLYKYSNEGNVLINTLELHTKACRDIEFSLDGDDDGTVKIWDMREKDDHPIYKTKKNEDYISDMVTNESKKFLFCASGDGSLTTIDLHNRYLIYVLQYRNAYAKQ